MTFRWAIALLPCVCIAQLDRVGPPNSNYALLKNHAAVEAGQKRFLQLCSGCHGRSGEGGQGEGQGPNLITSWEVRRAQDRALFGFIKDGTRIPVIFDKEGWHKYRDVQVNILYADGHVDKDVKFVAGGAGEAGVGAWAA